MEKQVTCQTDERRKKHTINPDDLGVFPLEHCMCPSHKDALDLLWSAWRSGDGEPVGCHWEAERPPHECGSFCVVPEDGMGMR